MYPATAGKPCSKLSITLWKINSRSRRNVAEKSPVRIDNGVLLGFLVERQLLVGLTQIEFGESFTFLQGGKQVLHFGNGVPVKL